MKKIFLCILFILIILNYAYAEDTHKNKNIKNIKFEPKSRVLNADTLRAGDTGYILTVLQGFEPVKIPVKVMSVITQNSNSVSGYILIKMLQHKLARGMSGSPVYIRRGRNEFLIGAVSIGWDFSDHMLAVVTPISDMIKIFNTASPLFSSAHDNIKLSSKLSTHNIFNFISAISVSGVSQAAAVKICKSLGLNLSESSAPPIKNSQNLKIDTDYKFKPGDAISVLLAWGDIEVSSTGTVTEVSRFDDGYFLAFGHPFLKRGNVCYPAAKAYIHATVDSTSFPFKIATPEFIAGTVMCDKEAGVCGKSGFFAQSIGAELNFKNLDTGESINRKFRVINDEFLAAKILEGAYTGLVEDAWGRKGQGTMSVNLRIDGRGIENGWACKNIFYNENNIESVSIKQASEIISAVMTQPFNKTIMPLGFKLNVEASSTARALMIEDVEAPEKAKAGEEFDVKVKLRPWRGKTITRSFKLKIPENTAGTCELIVRGGGVQSSTQLAVENGWKTIDSLELMLREIAALDTNNELILELQSDAVGELINNIKNNQNNQENKNNLKIVKDDKLLPEEKEFLSQTKERRIKEGTMRIFRSDYFVDGLIRRVIDVDN